MNTKTVAGEAVPNSTCSNISRRTALGFLGALAIPSAGAVAVSAAVAPDKIVGIAATAAVKPATTAAVKPATGVLPVSPDSRLV